MGSLSPLSHPITNAVWEIDPTQQHASVKLLFLSPTIMAQFMTELLLTSHTNSVTITANIAPPTAAVVTVHTTDMSLLLEAENLIGTRYYNLTGHELTYTHT